MWPITRRCIPWMMSTLSTPREHPRDPIKRVFGIHIAARNLLRSLVCALRLCTELSKLATCCAVIVTSQTLHDIARDLDVGTADTFLRLDLIRSSRNSIQHYHAASPTKILHEASHCQARSIIALGTPPPWRPSIVLLSCKTTSISNL
jgi:hypothetical protein